jgi:hypothetical protein
MIRREEYLGKQFLPNSLFTSNLFARDYFLIQDIFQSFAGTNDTEKEKRIQLVHQVLLFHQ